MPKSPVQGTKIENRMRAMSNAVARIRLKMCRNGGIEKEIEERLVEIDKLLKVWEYGPHHDSSHETLKMLADLYCINTTGKGRLDIMKAIEQAQRYCDEQRMRIRDYARNAAANKQAAEKDRQEEAGMHASDIHG